MTTKARSILITGAAKRVGRHLAWQAAAAGHKVLLHYNRSGEEAQDVRDMIRKEGGRCHLIQFDLLTGGYEQFVEDCFGIFDDLNCLINNASVFPKSLFSDLTKEHFFTNLTVHSWAPFALTREFACRRPDGGNIVNILDTRISFGYDQHVGYHLSKKLLEEITYACACEYAPGFRVNGIAPGLILPPEQEGDDYLERKKGDNLLNIAGGPESVWRAAAYLMDAEFVTGQVLFVDGGEALIKKRGTGG